MEGGEKWRRRRKRNKHTLAAVTSDAATKTVKSVPSGKQP
jgi:hypothetical protein